MKIQTKIGYGKVTITEPMIADVYQITSIDVRERGSIAANHIEVGAR